jgi:hypothetical protein
MTAEADLTTTEKAALVRAHIKRALRRGALGECPEGIAFSVRTEYASLMSAINVTIKGAPDVWAFSRAEVGARLCAAATHARGT